MFPEIKARKLNNLDGREVDLMDGWDFRAGRALLAIALCGLGIIALAVPGPLGGWMPLPSWLPAAAAIGRLMGFALFTLGASLVILPDARRSLLLVTAVMLSWIFIFHPARLVAGNFSLAAWLGVAEVGAVAAACWLLSLQLSNSIDGDGVGRLTDARARIATTVYGAALIVFGLCHFVYLEFTAAMVPDWMPARTVLAALTGAGHIAAGLALLSGILAGLATRLLTAMFASFVLFVHVSRVGATPSSREEWMLLCTSLLLTASAWIMASTIARAATTPAMFLFNPFGKPLPQNAVASNQG